MAASSGRARGPAARTSHATPRPPHQADERRRRRRLATTASATRPLMTLFVHRIAPGLDAGERHRLVDSALERACRDLEPGREGELLMRALSIVRADVQGRVRRTQDADIPFQQTRDLGARIAGAREQLTHELGRSPRPAEVADRLTEDLDRVVEALARQDVVDRFPWHGRWPRPL